MIDDLFAGEPEMRACAVGAATPGGTGALRHAIANYLEPGQALLTTSFFWGPYQTLVRRGASASVATFSMFDADGALDVGALDRALATQIAEQKRVLLFLNDPATTRPATRCAPSEWRAVVERSLARADAGADHAARRHGVLRLRRAAIRARSSQELRPLLGKVGAPLRVERVEDVHALRAARRRARRAACRTPQERAATEAALSYSCRGTWSNCNRGGHARDHAAARPSPRSPRRATRERDELKALLGARVAAFNALAPSRALRYPRYEGGFFVTVFHDDADERRSRMKEKGVFVVPQKGALRVALCSTAEREAIRNGAK